MAPSAGQEPPPAPKGPVPEAPAIGTQLPALERVLALWMAAGGDAELVEQCRKEVAAWTMAAAAQAQKQAMARSERMLQALVELGQDAAVLVSVTGRIQFATDNFKRIFFLGADELLGRDLGAIVHPEDLHDILALMKAMRPGQREGLRLRLQHGEREWRWVQATINHQLEDSLLGAVVVHFRDITDQMEAEAAIRETEDSLRRSEQHFRMLIESTSDMVVVLDVEQRPIYLNPATTKILGYTLSEIRGLNVLELVLPADRAQAMQALTAAAAGQTVSVRLSVQHKDGHFLLLESRGRYTKDPEGRMVLVFSAHDVTYQAALEEREQQESKMEAIGRLAGGVAHDFNNLLTVIQGNAELAQTMLGRQDPAAEMMAEIASAAERAGDLTSQLLAFGRKKMLKLQILDVNALINENLAFLKRILGADIRVNTFLLESLPPVEMDSGHMTQVLLNLVANARDAMPKGGALNIGTSRAVVGPADLLDQADRAEGTFVRLSVEDSGLGMDPATLRRIFEPYFTTRGRGNGLGLATVFGIVKQGGGFLRVTSEPGAGSLFQIYLPVAARAAAAPDAPKAADEPGLGAQAPTSTVLVVDDEHNVRRIAALGLKRAGYAVLEAASGEEALAIWRESCYHGRPVALVLTDVIMPRMTGIQLAEQIHAELPGQAILLMSGFNESVLEAREGNREMPWPLIQKPFRQEQLLREVRVRIAQKGQATGA